MSRILLLYLAAAGGSFLVSALLTRVLIALAPRVGLVDEPGAEKFHRQPTPVGGGLAMYLALLPLLLVPAFRTHTTLIVLAASGVVALIGLIDDLRGVPAMVKFVALLAMTGLLWSAGVGATTTRVAILDLLITVLWVTGVSSAFNAIDNMDGLATGVAAIAALGFLVIALQTQQWVLGGLSAALLGSSLGFLVFNFPPARIFMGDAGSFFLGLLLASLGVVGDWNYNEVIAAIIPILVLGLPIFDLGFTVLRRHRTGVTRGFLDAIRHCDTDHLSHRLVRIGLSPRRTVLILYLLAASFGISAVTLRDAAAVHGIMLLLQAAILFAALIPIFCLAEARPRAVPADGQRESQPRQEGQAEAAPRLARRR